MSETAHPHGQIKSFEFKLQDRKTTEDAPFKHWLEVRLWPTDDAEPTLVVGLWFPNTHNKAEADAIYSKALKLRELLEDLTQSASFETWGRTPVTIV
jgi:hypothetical protein